MNFLRRLRQRLLTENKFSKYLFYAFGEIILVVIGILIALQLNNWNEIQKNKSTEHELLSDVLSSLEKDRGRTQGIYHGRALVKQKAIDSLVQYANRATYPPDSVVTQTLDHVIMTLSFGYDKGAYESLKSYGLDKIQNDTLRKVLVRMYEVNLPLWVVFINNDRNVQAQRRAELVDQLTSYSFEKNTSDRFELRKNLSLNGLKENHAFQRLIALEQNVSEEYNYRLEGAIRQFDRMIELLEKTLHPAP
jgi:Family of unknown function (DUF6090)